MADEIIPEEENKTSLLIGEKEEGRGRKTWKGEEYVKSMVYAGLDAIVTCFSLISSISATRSSSVDVLVLGFANLVADGISMAVGDFVSSNTEKDMATKQRAVTEKEVTKNNFHHHLDSALIKKYQSLGMDVRDATTVVAIFAKYKQILVDEKIANEKGLMTSPYDEEAEMKPWKNCGVTFLAFLVFGSLPLLSFIVLIPFTDSDSVKFTGACVLAASALALLGMANAKMASQSYGLSVAVTLGNGAMAAGAAYVLGWLLRNVAHLEETENGGSL